MQLNPSEKPRINVSYLHILMFCSEALQCCNFIQQMTHLENLFTVWMMCTVKQPSGKLFFLLLNAFIVTRIWGQAVLTGYNKVV